MKDRFVWRSRWAALGAAVAVSLGGGGIFLASAAPGPSESTIVAVTPTRVLDTRNPVDLGLAGPFVSPTAQKLQITGVIPVAGGGTSTVVPAGATGVLLNVTSVSATASGFISIRPGDATGAPTTSSLNIVAGVTVPNSVQVALPTAGPNAGKIDITYSAFDVAGPTTDVLIDIVGYTTSAGLQQLVADVATKVTGGPLTMSYGPGSWTSPGVIGQNSSGLSVAPNAIAYLTVPGPETRGGVAYTVRDATFCLKVASGGGGLSFIVIRGFNGTSASETADFTNRTATGCYTVTADTATRGAKGFMVYLQALGAGTTVIGNVTVTWDTRTALGAASEEDFVDSGVPAADGG